MEFLAFTEYFKGGLTRDFRLQFFSWISVPWDPVYPIRIVSTFSKIHLDNRKWMFISGVNGTGGNLFGGVNDTADKFITGVNNTCD